MARTIYFISHPEVQISADVPVVKWALSSKGRERMMQLLNRDWIADISAVYCSDEQKAIDGAEILANHLGLPYVSVKDLGENDRSSTGFLEPTEFEFTADQFFNSPDESVRGWETAADAQSRIVRVVEKIEREDQTDGAMGIVSHGAVGTLLHCHLTGKPIDRCWDQPGKGGGNFMKIDRAADPVCSFWSSID